MTRYEKGRRLEYRARRLLEKLGYRITRSAGSKGDWDLIGIGDEDVVVASVKAASSSTQERARLASIKVPVGVRKLLFVFTDGVTAPSISEVKDDA